MCYGVYRQENCGGHMEFRERAEECPRRLWFRSSGSADTKHHHACPALFFFSFFFGFFFYTNQGFLCVFHILLRPSNIIYTHISPSIVYKKIHTLTISFGASSTYHTIIISRLHYFSVILTLKFFSSQIQFQNTILV